MSFTENLFVNVEAFFTSIGLKNDNYRGIAVFMFAYSVLFVYRPFKSAETILAEDAKAKIDGRSFVDMSALTGAAILGMFAYVLF